MNNIKVNVYENNAGGIACIVREGDKVSNVVLNCEMWEDSPEEIKSALMAGLPYCRDYDPDSCCGASMDEIASEIECNQEWIATVTPEGVETYPDCMGLAGRRMFGECR